MIAGLLALGLLLPSDDSVAGDPFEPEALYTSPDGFGKLNPPLAVVDFIAFHPVKSSREDILGGEFKYRSDDLSWRFSTPINWGAPHENIEVRRVLARIALADPFLEHYYNTGEAQSFKQAAFFFLDWQTYHQTERQLTPHAWDPDAVQARVKRLAFLLNHVEIDPTLLDKRSTANLVALADFHIQRETHPLYGAQYQTILQSPAFQALCETLDGLPRCSSTLGRDT